MRFFLAFSLLLSSFLADADWNDINYTASLSTTWTNNFSQDADYASGIILQPILVSKSKTNGSAFGCGFYCENNGRYCLFAIFIIPYFSDNQIDDAVVVWSANRNNLVWYGATLNFTAAGELVLQDVDGSILWTTNTTGKSVAGMNLTDTGNLVLFDVHNLVVWQSFHHPTDSFLVGQKLVIGQKLIPSVSETNWTAQKGLFSLQFTTNGLQAYVGSNPPQPYSSFPVDNPIISGEVEIHLKYIGGSLQLNFGSTPPTASSHYVKLMPDGHLKVFEWQSRSQFQSGIWKMVSDLFQIENECDYPFSCGRNAICTANQQCTCPTSNNPSVEYFKAVNHEQPSQGCYHITPLNCNATQIQDFIQLDNVIYFKDTYLHDADMENVDRETCKQVCLHNCSCKAAFFQYAYNSSSGSCYLPTELFTMTRINQNGIYDGKISTFIKVQKSSHLSSKRIAIIEASTIGSFVLLLVIVVAFITVIAYKRKRNAEIIDEEFLDQVPGLPTRFSYYELKTCTENFSKKLGEGGFGSVFEGTLEDGSKIAVKCLDGLAQLKKSFLAEVESIGSIHHVNLVRLIGFCAWKSQRLLVYEFMSNGSLDRWIYHGDRQHILSWECRKKIVSDIAKGLSYLHEECRQKIIHLDIKPQNILLDDDFNAKVSDFGLSKLIDRNQSHVMTTIRGTPGYMAPEWMSSIITEKVDVYSFGIVLLEILCGRKNFDRRQPEESWHLLQVFQKCWEQDKLLDLVETYSEDMQAHGIEVMEMMKVASWCLQTDFRRRPSMSTVIKVLEGGMTVEVNLDYNFLDPRLQKTIAEYNKDSTPLLPSVLSRPR